MHQELVLKKGIAADVSVEEVPGYRYPNMILFSGTPKSPHSVREIVNAFDGVVSKVKSELVPPDRIAASVNRQKVAHLARMASNYSLADDLVGSQLTMGNWRLVMEWYRQIENVSPEDIRRVARLYLTEDRRTLGELRNGSDAVEGR